MRVMSEKEMFRFYYTEERTTRESTHINGQRRFPANTLRYGLTTTLQQTLHINYSTDGYM
jgi:hypothetical protein